MASDPKKKATPAAVAPAPWAPPPAAPEAPAEAPVTASTEAAEALPPEGEVDAAVEAEVEEAAPEQSKEVTTADSAQPVEGEVLDMVTVTAPKAFNVRLDHFRVIAVKAGVQELERSVAEHWYCKANGLTIYDPKAK